MHSLERADRVAPANVSGATRDEQVIELWLAGRPDSTRRAYRRESSRFLEVVGIDLRNVTLADLQGWVSLLTGQASTVGRAIAAVRSLFGFAHSLGYLPVNVAPALIVPKKRDRRAERILDESAVLLMIASEKDKRNRALLRVAYGAGLRVSELVGIQVRDVVRRESGAQVSVMGKGGKERTVLVSEGLAVTLADLIDGRPAESYLFISRKRKPLSTSQAWRVVRAAARRIGLLGNVSPHWLRHAHASHALDRGAPIHLVQTTLGHASVATTGVYLHARPNEGSGTYLAV